MAIRTSPARNAGAIQPKEKFMSTNGSSPERDDNGKTTLAQEFEKLPADNVPVPSRNPNAHFANGGKLRLLTLSHLDGRTLAARRARELIEAIQADLGGGDRLSEGEKQLVQRAAVLGAYIESHEVRWLNGETVDLADYLAACNTQRRILATVGLQRRTKDIGGLGDLLRRDLDRQRKESSK
jgi:hypothetical protein